MNINNKTIMVVFGTRPEAIKLAPIILKLRESADINCLTCVTAQHRQMLDQVLAIFGIVPDIDLNLMKQNQCLADLTATGISELHRVFGEFRPDMVIVQGDTTTVFCAALAAYYLKIPLGHVEAGLRTGNIYSPWPEEANRTLTTKLSQLHFAPTARAKSNLISEGVGEEDISITGNTAIDALYYIKSLLPNFEDLIECEAGELAKIPDNDKLILITGHRRESFGEGFEKICKAIHKLAVNFPEVHFVYPVHLNPSVRQSVSKYLVSENLPNLHLLEPLTYPVFVYVMCRSYFILTDSGGVQEEAPSLGKPVLVMRAATERAESIECGSSILVGNDDEAIYKSASCLLTDEDMYDKMSHVRNPYGDGTASDKIIKLCINYLVNK